MRFGVVVNHLKRGYVPLYKRDVSWLNESDIVFAEITVSSLGVGYEIAYAESKNKKIVCMYEKGKNISKMITGNINFVQIPYEDIEELLEQLKKILEK